MKRFKLDDEQTDAILELKLYQLARLEILRHPRRSSTRSAPRRKQIEALLKDEASRWKRRARRARGDRRASTATSAAPDRRRRRRARVRRRGLHRRRGRRRRRDARRLGEARARDQGPRRRRALREGDAVLAVAARLDARSRRVLLQLRQLPTSCAINDVPASTGYGEPVQKLSSSTTASASSRALVARRSGAPRPRARWRSRSRSAGFGLRFALDAAPRARRRAPAAASRKPADGDEVVGVLPCDDRRRGLSCVTARRRTRCVCKADEIAELAGPGRGVTVIKIDDDDAVIGFVVGARKTTTCSIVETEQSGKKSRSAPGRSEAGHGARRQGPPDRQARKLEGRARHAGADPAASRTPTLAN